MAFIGLFQGSDASESAPDMLSFSKVATSGCLERYADKPLSFRSPVPLSNLLLRKNGTVACEPGTPPLLSIIIILASSNHKGHGALSNLQFGLFCFQFKG